MKMGTIASPWRYDTGAWVSPRQQKLRSSAISRYHRRHGIRRGRLMCIHPIEGFENWKIRLKDIRETKEVRGLEWLFVFLVHFLHVLTLSGWIKFAFDPLVRPPPEEEL